MSHPAVHARNAARKFNCHPEDTMDIHEWFDQSKELHADMRHRFLRHQAAGIYEAQRVFGMEITNTKIEGLLQVRYVGEQHIVEDLGFIPTLEDWLENMELQDWMMPLNDYSPLDHARLSAYAHGGAAEDYIEIHKWMDNSKYMMNDVRHNAYHHHTAGISEAVNIFGEEIVNQDGNIVSVATICENHILHDYGFIPTLKRWLDQIEMQDWMMNRDMRIHKDNKRKARGRKLPKSKEDLLGKYPEEDIKGAVI